MSTAGNLRPKNATFKFRKYHLNVVAWPHVRASMFTDLSSVADTSTGKWHPQHKFFTRSGQYSPRWSVLPSVMRGTLYHPSGTMKPTVHCGGNFLGRLEMRRPSMWCTGSSGNFLLLFNLAKENPSRRCYPSCRSSHVPQLAHFPAHSSLSLMHARKQAALYM